MSNIIWLELYDSGDFKIDFGEVLLQLNAEFQINKNPICTQEKRSFLSLQFFIKAKSISLNIYEDGEVVFLVDISLRLTLLLQHGIETSCLKICGYL